MGFFDTNAADWAPSIGGLTVCASVVRGSSEFLSWNVPITSALPTDSLQTLWTGEMIGLFRKIATFSIVGSLSARSFRDNHWQS